MARCGINSHSSCLIESVVYNISSYILTSCSQMLKLEDYNQLCQNIDGSREIFRLFIKIVLHSVLPRSCYNQPNMEHSIVNKLLSQELA
ncbi:hypothetical protein FGO68_gene15421 [Halteria grandinella]|uniref:Uncharacterized protein n=1 Tax=Halteria grandinella TaxID=5974 RepID=A0A8J8P1T4_HALGN|nr:hypothetical protein FGO68_gene15421 [Halteria grandinella]